MGASRPAIESLMSALPALGRTLEEPGGLHPAECLARLPERYFSLFDTTTVAKHLMQLCTLTPAEPYALDMSYGRDETELRVTVVSFDEPGVFSLLTGILGAAGFSIDSGSIFTLRRVAGEGRAADRRGSGSRRRRIRADHVPERRIVDTFVGSILGDLSREQCIGTICNSLDRVIPLLLPGGDPEAARRIVNEMVAQRLRDDESESDAGLYPVHLSFDTADGFTRMRIDGEDTPYFLYSLSLALTLQNVSIESVSINTYGSIVSDEFELQDAAGNAITDSKKLDQIRFSVLLTKQFTYFLDKAPDPYSALVRFESLSRELTQQTENKGFTALLSSPLVLRDLAQLLGASDFLWEDFIRRQYENILPLLDETHSTLSTDPEKLETRLNELLAHTPADERPARLNEFKDTETFLIDLDHILLPDRDFFFLSDRLSALAEVVVRGALAIAWEGATRRYGTPRTVAGLEAVYSVFGLGKLGGRALGYASDIELLFVYSDTGTTDGGEKIPNEEFFERLFTDATGLIESKREGIFQIDLRLRPHGSAGPHAVSLESFNRYYGRDGDAHSYEKLALTRLRCIGGDREFGLRVERLRDELIYATDSIDLAELRNLRERQLAEKAPGGRLNAKFSPGGLVDLEYGLQILLVQHGRTNLALRTPSLHSGMDALRQAGIMNPDEVDRLIRSYRFLRNLINGLRMLRGNAQDLFLPEVDSLEFSHLARRAGYHRAEDLSPEQQLRVEFESRTAAVRAFLEQHLGRDSIPGPHVGNAADLVLSHGLEDEAVAAIAERAGLCDPDRALRNVRSLAGDGERRERFSELIILAWPTLRATSAPDMALNNWERYAASLRDDEVERHFTGLLRQPRMLELMLQVFSASQFLSDTLIHDPAFLDWSLLPAVVSRQRSTDEMCEDLRNQLTDKDRDQRLETLRRFRRREILRIGTRDICLRTDIRVVTAELSSLATAILRVDLDSTLAEAGAPASQAHRFCVLAFGKLGGGELNYSSDIDLFGLYADGDPSRLEEDNRFFSSLLKRVRDDLMRHTTGGHVYRVDFRLRPYGSSGPLVQPMSAAIRYYEETAAPWEHQALLRLYPVAGNLELGQGFLDRIKVASVRVFAASPVKESIRHLRELAVKQLSGAADDLKSGEGGIRDLEFLIQGLQMVNAEEHPEVLTGNSFRAIDALEAASIVPKDVATEMRDDYSYLRRVEHYLQVYEDRQVHALPSRDAELNLLARRLHGPDVDAAQLRDRLDKVRSRVRSRYLEFLQDRD